ncbi:MAG: hypothetical protein R3C62_24715 [Chloroflexota bacterium]
MLAPFIERPPTKSEFERLRLILSTYQDGTGMEAKGTLPGWRDFERAIEAGFGGYASENKHIYDVLLAVPNHSGLFYGIDCKMRGLLSTVDRKRVVTIEVTNAAGELWDSIKQQGITQETYMDFPQSAGHAVLNTIASWHDGVSTENGGNIITHKSIYLVLQWNPKTVEYQLFQYPAHLPNPADLQWNVEGRRLIGKLDDHPLVEWYGLSGGQLKYYPAVEAADWVSPKFKLEALPQNIDFGLQNKAAMYFPVAWAQISHE